MPSGELAHLTGVSTDTLRYDNRFGLLPREFAQGGVLSPLTKRTGREDSL
jgi:DNA-binding transcriptional MerR regulator